MKGPRGRWKHDVTRVWECPHCKRRAHTSGAVAHKLCGCITSSESPMWMKLVEPMRATVRVKEEPAPSTTVPVAPADPPSATATGEE